MFNTISWAEFLLAIALLCSVYYLICGMLFYHREIIEWFKGTKPTQPRPANVPAPANGKSEDLLGKIRRPPATTQDEYLDDADEIQFGNSQEENVTVNDSRNPPDPDATLILGKVSDLMDEAKTIVSLFPEEKANQEEIAAVFRALLEKYAPLKLSRYADAVNIFLLDLCKNACAFELSSDDVKAWWLPKSHN
jgi:hypothetical protein